MRFARLMVALLTFALMSFATVLVASPAEAKEARTVTVTFKDGGRNVMFKGRVKPGNNTRIVVQRRQGTKGKWGNYKKIRTSSKGRYSFNAPGGPEVGGVRCYRVKVAGNKDFKPKFQTTLTYPKSNLGQRMCVKRIS